MKKFKKIFAVLLTLAMVLGMSMTSFAAAKITVTLPTDGVTVTYKKIVEPDRTSPDGWKFVKKGYESLGISIQDLISLGEDSYAADGKMNPSKQLADALNKVDMADATNATVSGVTASIPAGDGGLYVIVAEKQGWTFTRMLAFVKVNGTDVNVTAKGSEDPIHKSVSEDAGSVTKDDTATYTITTNYPFYNAAEENKLFEITDTLTNGVFGDDINLQVSVGENFLTPKRDYDLTKNDDNGFTLNLGGDYYKADYAGQTVTISYDVVVTNVTTTNPLDNTVVSTIMKPEGDPSTTTAKVISPAVKVEFSKVDEQDKGLDGAEFTLYVKVDKATEADAYYTSAAGEKEATITPIEAGEVVPEGAVLLKKVDTDTSKDGGKVSFDGLDAQKEYYVVETQAPEGFSLNAHAFKLTGATFTPGTETLIDKVLVTENKATNFTGLDEGALSVTNTKLGSLPSTGGIGTTIFTIGGCAIMIIAAALFFASRRKSSK